MVCVELEEKVSELTSELERVREWKKQVEDNKPSIDSSIDDITFGKLIVCINYFIVSMLYLN